MEVKNLKYPLIKLPERFRDKKFVDFNKEIAEDYLNWFQGVIPERLEIVETFVFGVDYANVPIFDVKSLDIVEKWFLSNLTFRDKSTEEIKSIEDQLINTLFENVIHIDKKTLTAESVSICFDVSLYFAMCLMKSNRDLYWTYLLKPKDHIHFGQPVLSKEDGKMNLNPRSIFEMKALKVLEKTFNENDRFVYLFKIWSKIYST